ncbi:hypothetical protein TTHERM_00471040 (macronuclear) [Tetrahymena thermophila SB210]|uniref:Uncharacterized protein n=2 Tax=Tetrahymena thermophila TaxID=5911 RepID=I7MGM5_TETTS|nr:hypothetical protein TTHERM_00471040 [Tetrahymena thermophila SB210]ABC75091.1 C-terminal crystallin fold containing protein 8p [Tetrahymena thermophila]EAR85331.1 hypothetical protein TTHERM_00471040 [Tetrahymena thermophila SB210]|eukprot:XP_001032994.1 hypothetical protein TTHERM_00471040 [Tetrahymena thermophila SB210]
MSRRVQQMLLIIALLGTLQVVTSQKIIVSSYIQAKAQNVITVPKDQLSQIKSLSIEGWVRPSQTMDYPYPASVPRKSYSLIMGSSTSSSGWGDNVKGVDSFLNLYTNKWTDQSGFILAYENGKNFEYIYNNLRYADFFGRWFFVYGVYLSDIQKHYLVTYSAYDESWQEAISSVVKKNPIIDFYQFSVNSQDVKKSVQFNGYIADPNLTYSASSSYYSSLDQLKAYISQKQQKPKYIGVLQKTVFTYIGQSATIPDGGLYESFGNYQGADEYSINGQAQFTGAFASVGNTILFRLGTNNPEVFKSFYEEGDLALLAYVQNGKKTCMQTYRINLSATDLTNGKQCFDVVPKKGEWFYFYQGYSRKLGRVFNYVRIGGQNYYAATTDVLHVDPNAFYLFVGQDSVSMKWAGSFQGFNLEFGPGAYRETLITEFPPVKDKSVKDKVVIPKTYVDPQILQSKASQTLAIDAKIVSQNYISSVKEYAIHFWFRRDLITPELIDFQAAKSQQSVAGVTERDDYTSTDVAGDAALSIQYLDHSKGDSPAFVFTTYNDAGSDKFKSATVNFDTKFDQGQWIWVYFAYSQPLQQASIYVGLPDGQTKIVKQINQVSHSQAHNLKALIGRSGTTMNPVTGQFYDAQFVYYDGCYQSSTATIENYKAANVKNPPSTQPKQGVYSAFDRKSFSKKNPPTQNPNQFTTEVAGALQYGLAAWARWNKSSLKNAAGNLLFTLSIYDKTTIGKTYNKLGSLVLQVYYKKKYLYFSTYQYVHAKLKDVNPAVQKFFVPKNARTSWCYYYFGYSHLDQQAVGSVKCLSGFQHEVKFDNTNHIIPSAFTFQVAKDDILNIWKGEVYQPSVIIGYPVALNFQYDNAYYPQDPSSGSLPDDDDSGNKQPDEGDDDEPEEEDDPKVPSKPATDPSTPATNTTTPVTNPVNPATNSTTPVTNTTTPETNPIIPATNTTIPATNTTTPATNTTTPDVTPVIPATNTTTPATNTTTPATNTTTPTQPQQPSCAVIYSECGYTNKIQEVCQNIPSLEIRNIRSIQVPNGTTLKFFQKENYKGVNVKFLQSVECIELGLKEDPKIQWDDLVKLFNAGKIGFIDSEGNDIGLHKAKKVFFKTNLRMQLRKKHSSD